MWTSIFDCDVSCMHALKENQIKNILWDITWVDTNSTLHDIELAIISILNGEIDGEQN